MEAKKLRVWMVAAVCAVLFPLIFFGVKTPYEKASEQRTPVTVNAAIDGNGHLHDVRVMLKGKLVNCMVLKYTMWCGETVPSTN